MDAARLYLAARLWQGGVGNDIVAGERNGIDACHAIGASEEFWHSDVDSILNDMMNESIVLSLRGELRRIY